jgi:hypothetical protein
MTIKDLPILDPIQAHFLNSQPLPNDFLTFIQNTEFYNEAKNRRFTEFKHKENSLAYLLLTNGNASTILKEDAIEKYGRDAVNNAQRHLNHLIKRRGVSPIGLHYAAIAWYVQQIVNIDKTIDFNKW